jgi:2-(1,2-epoxy-1,2-dihydrophenyl)acetyl-CoA isomerase
MSGEILTLTEAGVLWLEINRPKSRNALTVEAGRHLAESIEGANRADVSVIVVSGREGSFCSGFDLAQAKEYQPLDDAKLEEIVRDPFHRLIRAIQRVSKPTIAAVDGAAVGFGCDLALACDLRLISDRAKFGEVFVKRGLMPDGGGTYTLPRIVGLGRALEIMYTGRLVESREALDIGLANAVFPAADFRKSVEEFAAVIARGAPVALKESKYATYAALDGTIEDALELELAGQKKCVFSQDFQEGIRAFFEKREPKFQGK